MPLQTIERIPMSEIDRTLLKYTPLTEVHVALNAKMAPFAGYAMPISYEGVSVEHKTVREAVGIFDVSHMGEFLVTGPKALELLQYVTTNDVAKLAIGQAQYSCLPNTKGGIVDDLLIYKIAEEKYLLVVNASNIEKDFLWIQQHNTVGAELRNLSDEYALLAIQGPKATAAIQPLTSTKLSEIPYYHFEVSDFAGFPHVIISATGYTGSGGFEIYCKNEEAPKIWNSVLEAGAEFGIRPAGLAARDTLRLEMGYCLYGNDIDETTSPIEAGLGWITKFSKGDFVNKSSLLDQKSNGVSRHLIGFEIQEKGIPRQGYSLFDADGNEIGHVTSGTMSPTLQKGIGLGYVVSEHRKAGSEIYVGIRNKKIKAKVCRPPFYKK